MSLMVSVIVPTFNCASFIERTIESVLGQSLKPAELVVIDDGSTDATGELLRRFRSSISVHCQPNQGVAVARNRGMDLARGSWLLFLDADDELEDEALARLAAGAGTGAGVVYGHATHIDVHGARLREHPSRDCTGPVGSAARQHFGGAAFTPGCAIVRAALAREVRFDQRFAPCEDRDFWIRCGTRAEFVEVPHNVLRYRIRPGSHSSNRTKQVLQSVAVRLQALEWFERSSPRLEMDLSPSDVIDKTLSDVFWQREWDVVDRILELAADRNIQSPTIQAIRGKRRIPAWVHRLKDGVDALRGR
jgi:glycosyltransferase involved in cell wall biosynthesis